MQLSATVEGMDIVDRHRTGIARAVHLTVNDREYALEVDPRESLLDVLRERLDLTGTKKGCDQGACGACTVHVDGRRVLSCLTLAVRCAGRRVTTIEGVARESGLHPLQRAFVEHDGLQCGYCTPGQIMSALAVIGEGHAGSREEIREWMSGNLCRCGAYNGIVEARILNPGLNDYLIPAHADVPVIDVAFVEDHDDQINVLGVKGLGELPATGVAPAIANAVHHATGRRIRDLPIRPEMLI